MNIRNAVRLFVIALTFSTITFAAADPAAPSPQAPAAVPIGKKMLDSIPPELFKKMFQNHKLVGSPGLPGRR